MEKHKIDRINELARKKKSDGLTDEEAAEHAALRQEYIAGFRENMRQVLENTYVQRPDGTKTKLQKKTPTKYLYHTRSAKVNNKTFRRPLVFPALFVYNEGAKREKSRWQAAAQGIAVSATAGTGKEAFPMNQDEQQSSGVLRQTVMEVSSCFRTAS